jgi:transcriptional regulator with XRE-family HTH domain
MSEILWKEAGKRITELRHEKKLTQAQFGDLLGVSRQYIGKIERGQRSPGDLIPIICEKTGVSADFIYFGVSDPFYTIQLLHDFTPAQLDIALDIIKRLAELIYSPNGNELLIKEIMRRQRFRQTLPAED